MHKAVYGFIGTVLSLGLMQSSWAQFVAFNDHYAGPGTHANATLYNPWPSNAPTSGPLKDIITGLPLSATLTITTLNAEGGANSAGPAIGTPAYVIFNTPTSYIDWGSGSPLYHAIQLPDPLSTTPVSPAAVLGHVFSGLDPNKRYRFTGTTARGGDSTYANRWTLCELSSATSFTSAHSAGCMTSGTAGIPAGQITASQVAMCTGINTNGDFVSWDNIDPGPDGTFTILSSTYRGTVPSGSSNGNYGYAITGLKLEEFNPNPTPAIFITQPQSRTVNEFDPVSFTAVASGNPAPTIQWYQISQGVTNAIPNATNVSYSIASVSPTNDGDGFFLQAQNTVSNILYITNSSLAVLTVIADTTRPTLVNVVPFASRTNVTLSFSEAITEASATNVSNYLLTNTAGGPAVIIQRAVLQNSSDVLLTTSLLTNDATYVAVVNGVCDRSAAANPVLPSTTYSFVVQSAFTSVAVGGATPVGNWTPMGGGFDVSGGGTDVGGTSDAFQFNYQTRNGDFDVRVRVASQSISDPWAKVGLMARGVPVTSNGVFAAVFATPNLNGCFFQYRPTAGVASASLGSFPANYPYTWLRLQRTNATTWNGYASLDGQNWVQLGSSVFGMGDPVYLGFAITSRGNGVANSVQFREYGDAVNPVDVTSAVLPNEPLGPSSRNTGFVISEIMYNPKNNPVYTVFVDDILDMPSFAQKLQQPAPTDYVSAFVASQLSTATQNLLAGYSNGPSPALQQALVADLNTIISGPSIYDPIRFENVELRRDTQDLLNSDPQGSNLAKLNRMLLEDAYPGELSRNPNSLEFIEIFNSEPVPQSLGGFRLSGSIHYRFPTNVVLAPGGMLVVARDPLYFQSVYGMSGVLGPWYADQTRAEAGDLSNNSLPGDNGTIRLRNRVEAVLLEINYFAKNPWPIAADGTGHSLVLARPSYGANDPRAWAASDKIGGSPGKFESVTFDPLRSVMINEFLANSHTTPPLEDYIELYNHSTQPVDLRGAYLSDSRATNKFRFTNSRVLGARGFVHLTRSELPFGLNTGGGRIYLVNSNADKVIDVVDYSAQGTGISFGRYPDGAPVLRELQARTPGEENAPMLLRDIVINEIMYNPMTGDSEDEYVELYNKGAAPVDLLGWKFTDGITFTFTNSMIIPSNGYVVVAKNKERLKSRYGLNDLVVAGNFGGNLGNGGERLALDMPEIVTELNNDNQLVNNTYYITVSEVTYSDAGRWGEWSDGGGSSLELIDPHSDNRQTANWADSDESSKASWQTVSITITNGIVNGGSAINGMPNNYSPDNLHIYLLDVGECLVDEVRVLSGAVNLLTNGLGSFDNGVVLSNASLALLNANGGAFPANFITNWVAQGSYDQSTIEPGTGESGTSCLHLRAGSHGDTGPNKIRSPFFSVNASGVMTLQASVKWLRGWPEIILRTHGGGYEVVGYLNAPNNLGSPGAPNSRLVANAGPAIWDVVHSPILPAPNQPVVVTARAYDPEGVNLALMYRVNPNANFVSVPMLDNGAGGDAVAGDGLYSGTIPAQPDTTIVSFYLQAVDGSGATNLFPQNVFPKPGMERCFPNDSLSRECLIRWGDYNMPGSFATYHMWMTTNTVQRWKDREPRSNGGLDMTFAYNNCRVIYNGTVKSAGSPFHRGAQTLGPIPAQPNRVDYDLAFNGDEAFLGETGASMVVPGNTDGTKGASDLTALAEKISLLIADETGVPNGHRRYVHSFVNGDQRSKVAALSGNFLEEDAARPNGAFLRTWFPDDSEGDLVKVDDWFEFNDASTGFQNHNATLTRRSVFMGTEMLQTNKYRYQWQRRSEVGRSLNNWSNFMGLVNAMSPVLNDWAQVNLDPLLKHADMHQWAKEIAVRHSVGDFDAWGYDRGKNNFMYKPTKGRYQFLPFDVDWSMGQQGSRSATEDIFKCGPGTPDFNSGDPRGVAMYTNPAIRRIFLGAYQALIEGPYNNAFLNPIIDQWTAAFTANNISYNATDVTTMKTYIQNKYNFIGTYLGGATNPYIMNTPPSSVLTNAIILSGYAPVSVKTIKVNGIEYPITWATINIWSIGLYLNQVTNQLVVTVYDRSDNLIPGLSRTNVVVYTGPIVPVAETILFHEIMYSPVLTNAYCYVELFNASSNLTFDVSGWQVNGLGNYTFPGGSYLTPRQYVILAKNREAFGEKYGKSIPVFDTFDGQLDLDGETLTLLMPGATAGDWVTVDKVRYEAARPWPATGSGVSLQLMDLKQDNARVGNWAAGAVWRYFSSTGSPRKRDFRMFPDVAGDVYIDDLRLVTGSDINVGTNLFNNPGFETGNLFPWSLKQNVTNSVVTSTVAKSGQFCLHLITTSGGNPIFSSFGQSVPPVATNGICSLSYWYLSGSNMTRLTTQFGEVGGTYISANTNLSYIPYTPGASNSVAVSLPAFPPLWLNEVQPKNLDTRTNSYGEYAPWVELYNAGTNQESLAGLFLANNYSSNLTQWAFPAEAVIEPGEFKVIWLDGSNSVAGELHASFTIPESTGAVALVRMALIGTNNVAQVVDYLTYSGVGAGLSYGDFPDGQPFNRQIFFNITPGGTNDGQHKELYINEWIAQNQIMGTNAIAGVPNPVTGAYDDWFELYNPNDVEVNLKGYYLTDTNANPTQFRIPAGYIVPPRGFLMVWADNDTAKNQPTNAGLHVNFQLSRTGEQIGLYDPNTNLVDLVSFGLQTVNVSQGRYADGSSKLVYMGNATPGLNNIWFTNAAPVLTPIPDQVVLQGQTLYVTNQAIDPDIERPQRLLYHLGTNRPFRISMTTSNGLLTFTPTNAPATNVITVWVEDNGVPRLSATNTFTIYVYRTNGSANTAPVIGALSNYTILAGTPISFTVPATDAEAPPQSLSFSLEPGAPVDATLNATSGLFAWTPGTGPSTNQITVRVTDNGTPALSSTRNFTVVVAPPIELSIVLINNGTNVLLSSVLVPGWRYNLAYKDNLSPTNAWQDVPGYGNYQAVTENLLLQLDLAPTSRFYRMRLIEP